MIFEVPIHGSVYVSVEFGGADQARRLVRDHVANDWLLQVREGTAKEAGKYLLKGAPAEVGQPEIFRPNRSVVGEKQTAEAPIEEEIF